MLCSWVVLLAQVVESGMMNSLDPSLTPRGFYIGVKFVVQGYRIKSIERLTNFKKHNASKFWSSPWKVNFLQFFFRKRH